MVRMRKTCKRKDCERPHKAKGWCQKHYQNAKANGGRVIVNDRNKSAKWKLLNHVKEIKSSFGECHEYLGDPNNKYPRIYYQKKQFMAKNVAWWLFCKPKIKAVRAATQKYWDGLRPLERRCNPHLEPKRVGELSHIEQICGNNRCVNPDHLSARYRDEADLGDSQRALNRRRGARQGKLEKHLEEIVGRLKAGEKLRWIALSFGVAEISIQRIRDRETWKEFTKDLGPLTPTQAKAEDVKRRVNIGYDQLNSIFDKSEISSEFV